MKPQIKFQTVRRKDRVATVKQAWEMLASGMSSYGFLGTHGDSKENQFPYVVPMNYVYNREDNSLYLHSTNNPTSKRFKVLKKNNRVTFVIVDRESVLDPDLKGIPCNFSMNYKSVMVFGTIKEIANDKEKTTIMNGLMKAHSPGAQFHKVQIPDVGIIAVWKLTIEHLTGKKRRQP